MARELIFDWSGTLVDDLGPVVEATAAVFRNYGIPPLDRAGFREHFRLPYRGFYEAFVPGVPLEEMEEVFRVAFRASRETVFPLPGAEKLLQFCQQAGIRCYVCTSMDADDFARQLREFGWENYFVATYAAVADKRRTIHEMLETHQISHERAMFVGDMTHDIEAGQAAGMETVALLTGYMDEPALRGANPTWLFQDLAGLQALLEA